MNIILSKKLGGMQQVFLDYDLAIRNRHRVLNIIHPFSKIKNLLEKQESQYKTLFNLNHYDFFAKKKLASYLKQYNPNLIIIHGNRAAMLVKKFSKKLDIPTVYVCHNQRIKKALDLEYLIVILKGLGKIANDMGKDKKSIFYLPNSTRTDKKIIAKNRSFLKTPVIGTISRLVPEKSLDVFIKSLFLLKEKKLKFKAIIAGSGKLEKKLKLLVEQKNLTKEVEFLGWIDDKDIFFKKIDIFCLSSKTEHFSISLLDAMLRSKPIVTTDSFGPREVIKNMKTGLVVKKENPELLAEALEFYIKNEKTAKQHGKNIGLEFKKKYLFKKVAKDLNDLIDKIAR